MCSAVPDLEEEQVGILSLRRCQNKSAFKFMKNKKWYERTPYTFSYIKALHCYQPLASNFLDPALVVGRQCLSRDSPLPRLVIINHSTTRRRTDDRLNITIKQYVPSSVQRIVQASKIRMWLNVVFSRLCTTVDKNYHVEYNTESRSCTFCSKSWISLVK